MRCPVCFSRDVDVLMRLNDDGNYSCLKCSFKGSEAAVREAYLDLQKKFRFIGKRIDIDAYGEL